MKTKAVLCENLYIDYQDAGQIEIKLVGKGNKQSYSDKIVQVAAWLSRMTGYKEILCK